MNSVLQVKLSGGRSQNRTDEFPIFGHFLTQETYGVQENDQRARNT